MIEVPVPTYAPLPAALTAPLPMPSSPPTRCTLAGVPAVCVLDALQQIAEYQMLLQTANADRARAATLGRTNTEVRDGR